MVRRLLTLVIVSTLTASACRSDGRELVAPPVGATAPPRVTTTEAGSETSDTVTLTSPTTDSSNETLPPLELTSPFFQADAPIPFRYTCEGDQLSPALEFDNIPLGAVELAVHVVDLETGFVHWIVSGLDPSLPGIDEGELPSDAVLANNGDDEAGWAAPCPDEGPHTYAFTLHALANPIELGPGAEPTSAMSIINEQSIARASLIATLP